MKLKIKKDGRIIPCSSKVWNSFNAEKKNLFEVIEYDQEIKVIKSLRDIKQ